VPAKVLPLTSCGLGAEGEERQGGRQGVLGQWRGLCWWRCAELERGRSAHSAAVWHTREGLV
jgi:hypothetical protein